MTQVVVEWQQEKHLMMSGLQSRSCEADSRACCCRSASSLLVLTAAEAEARKWLKSCWQSTLSKTSRRLLSSLGSGPRLLLQSFHNDKQ